MSIKQTIDLLSMQVGGYQNLEFRKMQLEDPSYFYSIQLDDDNQILNFFGLILDL